MAEHKTELKDVGEGIIGAVSIGINLLFSPFLRGGYNRWGATDAEVEMSLPGDELVPRWQLSYTNAVTIRASAAEIWPWLVQMGQGRGGLYSYEWLENLVGCRIYNADRIVPEWQTLNVGDSIRLGPKGYPLFKVVALAPQRALVLAAADPKTEKTFQVTDPLPAQYTSGNWIFFLDQKDAQNTRLIVRGRVGYSPNSFANVLLWRVFTEPIGSVMIHKMILGIKERAEAASR
jgi:hypothetical protein